MFKEKFKTNKVDIYYKNEIQNSKIVWLSISISKDSIYIYISRDNNRAYWIGRKKGISSNLLMKFNDKKNMISINSSFKVIFKHSKDYKLIKDKTIYYKHMTKESNIVKFGEN